jgi:hypothetical protein
LFEEPRHDGLAPGLRRLHALEHRSAAPAARPDDHLPTRLRPGSRRGRPREGERAPAPDHRELPPSAQDDDRRSRAHPEPPFRPSRRRLLRGRRRERGHAPEGLPQRRGFRRALPAAGTRGGASGDRLSFATSDEEIRKGLERLAKFVA